MARKVFLGVRIDAELKTVLEKIAHAEARSVSQVCELILEKGAVAYQKDSSNYLRRPPSHRNKRTPE